MYRIYRKMINSDQEEIWGLISGRVHMYVNVLNSFQSCCTEMFYKVRKGQTIQEIQFE